MGAMGAALDIEIEWFTQRCIGGEFACGAIDKGAASHDQAVQDAQAKAIADAAEAEAEAEAERRREDKKRKSIYANQVPLRKGSGMFR